MVNCHFHHWNKIKKTVDPMALLHGTRLENHGLEGQRSNQVNMTIDFRSRTSPRDITA